MRSVEQMIRDWVTLGVSVPTAVRWLVEGYPEKHEEIRKYLQRNQQRSE